MDQRALDRTRGGMAGPQDPGGRTTRSIGSGAQAFLVGCGILLFATGIVLSFGVLGHGDLIGGINDDVDDAADDVQPGEADDESQDDDGTGTEPTAPSDDDQDDADASDDETDDDGMDDSGDQDGDDTDADDSTGDDDADDADDADDFPGGDDDADDDDADGDDDADEQDPIAAETHDATNVADTSATLQGERTGGEDEEVTVFFEWRSAGERSWNLTEVEPQSQPGEFSANLTELRQDTEYEFRAVVETAEGELLTGETETFTTDEVEPLEVETDGVTDVGTTSATLDGDLTNMGESDRVYVGFAWREVGEDSWEVTDGQRLSSTGSYSDTITGLEEDTEYEFRAIAESDDGETAMGEIITFTTESDDDDDDDDEDDDDGDDDDDDGDDDDDDGTFPW